MPDPRNPIGEAADGITYDPATRHSYITTLAGKNIGPPGIFKPEHVRLTDIIQSLAMTCRYYGHVKKFYSVAEHSILVSYMAELAGDEEAIIPALFHDAHEAYMGDIASPQKDMIGQGCRDFEEGMETIVRKALDLPGPDDDVWRRIRVWDIQILHRELSALRTIMPDWYDYEIECLVPKDIKIWGFEWQEARSFFRNRISDLGFHLKST